MKVGHGGFKDELRWSFMAEGMVVLQDVRRKMKTSSCAAIIYLSCYKDFLFFLPKALRFLFLSFCALSLFVYVP